MVNAMDDAEDLQQVGRRLAAAYTELDAAREAARAAALTKATTGMSEARIAANLGVDRSTIRKWLGK